MRCFLAIELPEAIRRRLLDLQEQLQGLRQLVRWTKPEQMHLTLKFLGEVPDADIARLCTTVRQTAARLAPFDLEIGGTGCFPPRGPARIIWAGVIGPPPALLACHRAVEDAFVPLGLPPEERGFNAHLTLGRVRERAGTDRVRPAVSKAVDFIGGRFHADQLVLFQSTLTQAGSQHTPLAHAPLLAGS